MSCGSKQGPLALQWSRPSAVILPLPAPSLGAFGVVRSPFTPTASSAPVGVRRGSGLVGVAGVGTLCGPRDHYPGRRSGAAKQGPGGPLRWCDLNMWFQTEGSFATADGNPADRASGSDVRGAHARPSRVSTFLRRFIHKV